MNVKIKMEAVVAGLLAVKDNYIFTILGHVIAVSPRLNLKENHYILFDNNNFFKMVLTEKEFKSLCDDFGDAVD